LSRPFNDVLEESRNKKESLTSEHITRLYHILADSGNRLNGDYFSFLVAGRLKEEALEELEDSLMGDGCMDKSLLLPSELADQICSEVNASRASEVIPEFELEHNGIRIVSMRKLRKKHSKADDLTWRTEE
jgi:hypothetical protein